MAQGLLKSNKDRDGIAAVLLENIGNLEAQMQETQEAATAADTASSGATAAVSEMQGTLVELEDLIESTGLSRISRLNRPNLLKQNYWTTREMPTSPVITETFTVPAEDATAAAANLTFTVTNEAITANYKLHGWKISDYTIVSWTSLSGTFAAGSATITIGPRMAEHAAPVTVTVYLCTNAMTKVLYGNASRIAGSGCPYMKSINSGNYPGDDSADGIVCSVVDLAAADQITDGDGEVYNTAVQFAVTANSAYGNVEWLGFNNPNSSRVYTQGETKISNYGHLEEMQPGNHYTISFLARVISGNGAIARFGYGGMYNNNPINRSDGQSGVSDFVTIEGSTWKRYSWGFDFNPQGDWYTETSEDVGGVTKVTRSYNWAKKVSFGIGRKHTAVIQLCGFRLVEGGLYLPTKYDEVIALLEELKERVGDLEETIAENGGA